MISPAFRVVEIPRAYSQSPKLTQLTNNSDLLNPFCAIDVLDSGIDQCETDFVSCLHPVSKDLMEHGSVVGGFDPSSLHSSIGNVVPGNVCNRLALFYDLSFLLRFT